MVPDASSPTSKRGSAIRGIWLRGNFLRGHFSLPAMNRTRFQCYEPQRNAKCAYLFATSNALVAGRAAIHFAGQRPTRGSAFPGSPEVAFGQLTVPACDHLVVAFTHRRSTPLLGGNALRGLMKNVEMGGAGWKPALQRRSTDFFRVLSARVRLPAPDLFDVVLYRFPHGTQQAPQLLAKALIIHSVDEG